MGKKYNVMDHDLVPRHEIVPEEEAQEILEKHDIDAKKLPKILKSDPVVKEIGAKSGDILRITRDSPTAGKAILYRLVVDEEIGGDIF
ncbi:DNA-directed RNA polymerase subunit H RpoH/RPB5 [Methanonatronarchaeum thermophilum]|uniref:DNA-directed RNA polymerase subunit Rpo5 n=1 Tax=Methanonatronarchaeum thermophilum TaxID=1927129 RepID=A0A1Y3GBY3_9EURY|nr:DNA-directed RNA polymerase subunit H [Methanonatronarchaeum thermophilum]OUJ18938.1 DNA-directed RNA polymerase subunit H RpoH/RPB5 [Methanonatronarchaeum thermophilum]